MYDLAAVRAEFPITQHQAYLNSPAIGPLSRSAHAAGVAFLDERLYEPWAEPAPTSLLRLRDRKNHVRDLFAQLIGAPAHTVGLTESTSAGENIVVNAIDWRAGDNVVIDELHFESSLLIYRQLAERKGVEVRIAEQYEGRVSTDAIAALCDTRTRIVSVTYVSNRNGFRHDVATLAQIAHAHGAYLFVDAIQAVGTFAIDVVRDHIDFLTCGTYKWLYANFGVSFLYVRDELLTHIPSDRYGHTHITHASDDFFFDIQKDGRKYEYAAIAHTSLAQVEAGLQLLHGLGISHIEAHGLALAEYAYHQLAQRGFALFTPEPGRSAIVTFAHGQDATLLAQRLRDAQVAVIFREQDRYIRFGTSIFNSRDDVDRLLAVL